MRSRSIGKAAFAIALAGSFAFTVTRNNEPAHKVGELYQGGIVFSVKLGDDGAEHGLIVSLKDLSASAAWGKTNAATNATSKTDGAANTAVILAAGGSEKDAAGLCKSYSVGDSKDWYLPAIDELKALHESLSTVNAALAANNGESLNWRWMWSSTEEARGSAWGMDAAGVASSTNKLRTGSVRAVKKF